MGAPVDTSAGSPEERTGVTQPSRIVSKKPTCPDAAKPAATGSATPERLCWTARPGRHAPARMALALAAIIATFTLALFAFGHPIPALGACLALAGALVEAVLPVHHRVDAGGAFTRCGWQMRSIGWDAVRSVRQGPDGLHISPLPASSRLSRVRGVTLRYEGANAAAVADMVRRYWRDRSKEAPGTGKADAP